MIALIWVVVFIVGFLLFGLKIVNEYERGVRFTLGKYSGIMEPGLRLVVPIFQSWERVDIRTRAEDVPDQDAITNDNVSLKVNAVLYYRVGDAKMAILKVEDYNYAVGQLAQTTMRDVVGEATLDELLSKRDAISKRIKEIVDKATDPWGIKVESVELKHVELPELMKRSIGREAEAEREKRAVIIKARGELEAAKNMSEAAKTLSTAPGSLHLRTLQTLNSLSSDQSNTIVLGVPLEVLRAFEGMSSAIKEKKK